MLGLGLRLRLRLLLRDRLVRRLLRLLLLLRDSLIGLLLRNSLVWLLLLLSNGRYLLCYTLLNRLLLRRECLLTLDRLCLLDRRIWCRPLDPIGLLRLLRIRTRSRSLYTVRVLLLLSLDWLRRLLLLLLRLLLTR